MSSPKPPKLNLERLKELKKTLNKMDQLSNRLRQYMALLHAGKLPATFIAFEVLTIIYDARCAGKSDSELEKAWPREWGEAKVEVPLALLGVLADRWGRYRSHDKGGHTLGETFNLEGSGQGKLSVVRKQQNRDRRKAIAHDVIVEYMAAAARKKPISLEEAQGRVAQKDANITESTAKAAYQEHCDEVWTRMAEYGLTEREG